jgi:hypothetical protein
MQKQLISYPQMATLFAIRFLNIIKSVILTKWMTGKGFGKSRIKLKIILF